jgi:hypothetical protein
VDVNKLLLVLAALSTSVAVAQSTLLVRGPRQASADVASAPPSQLTKGPTWRGLSTIVDANKYDVNGFPTSNEFGGNATGTIQAFVGSISVPSVSTATNHGAGVSGYAQTASPITGAVGVFGFGSTSARNGQAWGGNFMAQNCPVAAHCATGTGTTPSNVYGAEIDVNLYKSYGAMPNTATRGLYIVGGSETVSSNPIFNALEIDSPGVFQRPKLLWRNAITVSDGAASNALVVGTTRSGNGVGSQPIILTARDHSGAVLQSSLQSDPAGNFIITAPRSTLAVLQSGACAVKAAGPLNEIQATCPVQLARYTVATLPACSENLKGGLAYVSDARSPAYNGTLRGGGSVMVPAFCNGSNWTAH